jgi:hypothetical protein
MISPSIGWRAAVDTIAGRELAAGRALPVSDLEQFVRDTRQHPRARRLAYELIAQPVRTQPNASSPDCATIPAPSCAAMLSDD